MSKAVLVMDVLPFECLNNANIFECIENANFFLLLWTTRYSSTVVTQLPYDGYINGLRNGFKPYKYLRMYLRNFHASVLGLPVIIVDFDRFYNKSRHGYDLCIDLGANITQQLLNNRPISVIDTKAIFERASEFVQQYPLNKCTIISEETRLSSAVVITSNDFFAVKTRPRIVAKQCVLVVSPSIFDSRHNMDCGKFREFLRSCYLVVWMDNKNVDRAQIKNFIATMRDIHRITINYMLFGLDDHVKSISLVRRHLAPTRIPFVLVDHLHNIYNRDLPIRYEAVCDFDLYVVLNEFYNYTGSFYNMKRIVQKIRSYLALQADTVKRGVKITECHDDDNNNDDSSTLEVKRRRRQHRKEE